jgi:hypothetical protein
MSNRDDRLIAGRLRDGDELAVFARPFLLRVVVTRRSALLREAIGNALSTGAE